jgi:hypothetical protein
MQNFLKPTKEHDEYILCSAIYIDNGIVYEDSRVRPRNKTSGFYMAGWRHHNCLGMIYTFLNKEADDDLSEQGFLTSKGNFLTREEAKELAIKIGQVKEDDMASIILTSEDLWG